MVVTYGRRCPPGYLPVFSVGSEQEARDLITLTCPTNILGDYIAPDLVVEQTLENLELFSKRLEKAHKVLVKNGNCDCV